MGHEQDHGAPKDFIRSIIHHSTSGTSAEPVSTPVSMLMADKWGWRWMFHGEAFLNAIQQSGPRGGDKVFSTNWFMPMAQKQAGPGTLTLRAMFSLEPATVTNRRYPELFQEGETAYGSGIVDGQHPHDFFMELAALYDMRIGEDSLLSLYAAPVGDPAMGPTAYPHRISASENPTAPLGHHLQDSTHIAYNVFTLGLTHKNVRIETSGFHGREPDEYRWDLDGGGVDSWSTRLTINPARNWSAQYSFARLNSPESLHPDEDVQRMTASVMYNRPLQNGNWATSLIWGRNRILGHHQIFNGYLLESTLKFANRNYIWGRVENADRTSELLREHSGTEGDSDEHFLARVQAYTAGYARELNLIPGVSTTLGGQVTLYGKPDFLTPIYGERPVGVLAYIRIRPFGNGH